jgi:hypothetical protein
MTQTPSPEETAAQPQRMTPSEMLTAAAKLVGPLGDPAIEMLRDYVAALESRCAAIRAQMEVDRTV